MKVNIKYNPDQNWKSYEVDNIIDLVDYNQITHLDCYNNQLSSLPDLPSRLTHLYCSSNELSSLPDLPSTLTYLDCSNNQLSSLPDLPRNLTTISSRLSFTCMQKTKDKYQELVSKTILYIMPWTRLKEYLINSLIHEFQNKCSKCNQITLLEERYPSKKGPSNMFYMIKTKICHQCASKN